MMCPLGWYGFGSQGWSSARVTKGTRVGSTMFIQKCPHFKG